MSNKAMLNVFQTNNRIKLSLSFKFFLIGLRLSIYLMQY